MPYPCLSYGFSLILQLNTNFYSPISDSCILCEQQVEQAIFEIILEKRAEVQKVSRNVATLGQREWKSTSGKCRDVSTSRRCNVSANSASNIIKSTWARNNEGIRNTYERGHKKESSSEPDHWRRHLILYSLLL